MGGNGENQMVIIGIILRKWKSTGTIMKLDSDVEKYQLEHLGDVKSID